MPAQRGAPAQACAGTAACLHSRTATAACNIAPQIHLRSPSGSTHQGLGAACPSCRRIGLAAQGGAGHHSTQRQWWVRWLSCLQGLDPACTQTTSPITPLPRVSCPRRAVSRPPLSTGWFRGMLEASAGLATQSVFMEGDSVFDPRTQVCDSVDCGPSRHRIVAAPTSTSLSRRMSRHADGLATAAGFACNVNHATCAAESNLNVVEYFPGTGPRRPEPARRPGGRQDAFSLCVRRQDNAAHPRDGGQVGFPTTIHPQPLSSQQLATPCVAPSSNNSFFPSLSRTLPFQGCV